MRKWLRIMNKIIIDGDNFDVNVDDCIEVNVTRKNKFLNVWENYYGGYRNEYK